MNLNELATKLYASVSAKAGIDPESFTTRELSDSSGLSVRRWREIVLSKVLDGELERCYKLVNGKATPSYRVKRIQAKAKGKKQTGADSRRPH